MKKNKYLFENIDDSKYLMIKKKIRKKKKIQNKIFGYFFLSFINSENIDIFVFN